MHRKPLTIDQRLDVSPLNRSRASAFGIIAAIPKRRTCAGPRLRSLARRSFRRRRLLSALSAIRIPQCFLPCHAEALPKQHQPSCSLETSLLQQTTKFFYRHSGIFDYPAHRQRVYRIVTRYGDEMRTVAHDDVFALAHNAETTLFQRRTARR